MSNERRAPASWPTDDMVVSGAEVIHDSLRMFGIDINLDTETTGTEIQQEIVEAVFNAMLAAAPKFEPVQEPVATVTIQHFRQDPSMENLDFQLQAPLPQGTHKLYASPVAQQKAVMPDDKTIEHVMADVCEENKEFEIGIPYYALCVHEFKEVLARLNRSKT